MCELNYCKPLTLAARILDPCCGSGVFLVPAYRRLIELHSSGSAGGCPPGELKAILTRCIYGIERNEEACFVTELSLILTLLSYVEPPELHKNEEFKFPELHNRNIFHADFFDDECSVIRNGLQFDWIIGNPPWKELDKKDGRPEDQLMIAWVDRSNARGQKIARYRASEAFTWRAGAVLSQDGHIAFLVHATSLINEQSEGYRASFFTHYTVRRVVNFSNLA
jgi:tRNA1(Val) A37 N6-methylase TrmN6